ncbi:hypothetical protein [Alteromonas aestuariivivens]|uniref:hypothetical protein n=1 Tax=Alteromonas aestuariivivens TaxID=1938339 RepID=UPI0015F2A009|nr:hypothetical protein [Alteromonas aestuariivivens]
MFQFTALIFTGTRQQLVQHQCDDEQAFTEFLQRQYGVHVCIWCQKQAAENSLAAE